MRDNKNPPLRLAVCFFGLAYGFGRATRYDSPERSRMRKVYCLAELQSIKRAVYANHDCDVFFHAWVDNEKTKENMISKLKPKAYIGEKQILFDEDAKVNDPNLFTVVPGPKTLRHATLSQTYSRTRSLELAFKTMKEENIEYDFIIALRNDLIFETGLRLPELKKNVLYVPNDPMARTGSPADFFFLGSPSAMKHLLGVEDHLRKEIATGMWNHDALIKEKFRRPEPMLERYYRSHSDLKVVKLDGDLDYRTGFWLVREHFKSAVIREQKKLKAQGKWKKSKKVK